MRILLSIFQLKYVYYLNQEKGNIEVPTPTKNRRNVENSAFYMSGTWV